MVLRRAVLCPACTAAVVIRVVVVVPAARVVVRISLGGLGLSFLVLSSRGVGVGGVLSCAVLVLMCGSCRWRAGCRGFFWL